MTSKIRTVGDVIDAVKKETKKADKKKLLKENDTLALRTLLRLQFDGNPIVKHDLAEGVPEGSVKSWPHEEAPANLSTIYKEYKNFLSANTHITKIQREMNFLKILSKLNTRDATILISVKDKNLELGLTKKELQSVFPNTFF